MTVSAPPRRTTTKAASKPADLKRPLSLAIQIVVWQIVAILVVELVLFLAGLGEEEIFRLDKSIGFTHMPNKRVTWRSEGYSRSYFNEDGMREPGLTVAKPEGTFRVAFLGDSMVEGLQVPVERSFGQLVERALKEKTGKSVQVLDFATSGYSTAQEYLQLKSQVVKYAPDLVILFYNNRDLFENWAPPDQTLTNVRPYALHLPGQPLVIDNSSVTQWMKSPRGKFLNRIEWLREHSRIWGLIAAWETQASFHDPVYRAFCAFVTAPSKTVKSWTQSIAHISPAAVLSSFRSLIVTGFASGADKPSFKIQFFEETEPAARKEPVKVSASAKQKADPALVSSLRMDPDLTAFPRTKSGVKPEAKAEPKTRTDSGQEVYVKLMTKTLASLLTEMDKVSALNNARLAVVMLPVKSVLLADDARSASMLEITYEKEIETVTALCKSRGIPILDCQKPAMSLSTREKNSLYHAVHFHERGHQFMAGQIEPFIKSLMEQAQK